MALSPERGGRPAEPSLSVHAASEDTQRLRSVQKLWLGCRAEPRSAEANEGLQEHKHGTMPLSYGDTPSPNLTEEEKKISPDLSSTSTSSAHPRGLGIQHALGPLSDRFRRGPLASRTWGCYSRVRDAGCSARQPCARTASSHNLSTKRDPVAQRGHCPRGGLFFWGISLISGRV